MLLDGNPVVNPDMEQSDIDVRKRKSEQKNDGSETKTTNRPKPTHVVKTKAHPNRCEEIYLKISLGEKLSARDQQIIINCK